MTKKEEIRKRWVMAGAFTLLELLVVISIISMLMSILLPSLTQAREQGKRIHCLANLKNLGYAWYMYTVDNDDKLCSADTGSNNPDGHNWVADGLDSPTNNIGGTKQALEDGVLWFYTGRVFELYKCKSDSSELLRSYSLSRAMNGKTCNCEHDNINPFKCWSGISRPAEKIVFADAGSRKGWIEGSFCPVEDITAEPPKWCLRITQERNNITARHSDGCSLSFADFHCKYWKYKDQRTVKFANWQIGANAASTDNTDLERMVWSLQGQGQ